MTVWISDREELSSPFSPHCVTINLEKSPKSLEMNAPAASKLDTWTGVGHMYPALLMVHDSTVVTLLQSPVEMSSSHCIAFRVDLILLQWTGKNLWTVLMECVQYQLVKWIVRKELVNYTFNAIVYCLWVLILNTPLWQNFLCRTCNLIFFLSYCHIEFC